MEEVFVYVDIDSGGDKRVREGQAYPPIEFPAFFFDGLADEGEGGDQRFGFAALEAGGDGVDGIEEEVCNPAEEG